MRGSVSSRTSVAGLRKLPLLLMLSAAALQGATSSVLLSSAFTLELFSHAHDHGHSSSVVKEGGHLHLVLTHAHDGNGEQAARHPLARSFSSRDHVIELGTDDAGSSVGRRGGSERIAVASPVEIVVALSGRPLQVSRATATARARVVRPIVLRL